MRTFLKSLPLAIGLGASASVEADVKLGPCYITNYKGTVVGWVQIDCITAEDLDGLVRNKDSPSVVVKFGQDKIYCFEKNGFLFAIYQGPVPKGYTMKDLCRYFQVVPPSSLKTTEKKLADPV